MQVQEEAAKAGMRSPRPCITMGIQGHTQAHTTPAREERSTRGTFTPEQNQIPATGPQGGLYAGLYAAQHQVRALGRPPARPPALPPHWLGPPSSWFPAKGEPDGRWGQDFGVGVLPGSREELLLEVPPRSRALEQPLCTGGRRRARGRKGAAVGRLRGDPLRCGAVRGAQALLPRGRLCGEWSSTDCRRRTSRSSQSVSGSRPLSTARRSCRLLAEGNSR